MWSFLLAVLAIAPVDAFPAVMKMKRDYAQPGCTVSKLCNSYLAISDAQANIPATPNAAVLASQARQNCGTLHSCTTFNAEEQYVSVTGAHAYQSPSATDIRGQCPGLNAAANHGYLPRSGIATIEDAIVGLGEMYGMSPDLAGFLGAYAVALDGDLTTLTWSIGGPLPANIVTNLLGVPQGTAYSHNNYEGDTSISRCDAYINGGDAHSSSTTRFGYAYSSQNPDGSHTLDTMARAIAKNTHRSIQQNPLYFAPLFSTTLVAPAAYNLITGLMSNYSAEYPAGFLSGYTFQSFFAMEGTYPNFKWAKGQDRIPENWYKRPVAQPYSIPDVIGDLLPDFLAYPDTFRFGGNTNGVNTYTGIDIANFTGGTYNAETLFEGDNFACFFVQTEQQALPQALDNGLNDVGAAIELITSYLGPFAATLSCPQLAAYDSSVFNPYAGRNYKPSAPTSGPVNC